MYPELAWEQHYYSFATTLHAKRAWHHNTVLHPIAFASKSLTGTEQRYSNIEHEVLGILHRLKFHHYCFGRQVLIITDHKPLVSMFKKDVATLLQHMQCILLEIHQYRVQIIYKPDPEIFIADWLSRHNHVEGKDKPIKDMNVRVDAIQSAADMPEWHIHGRNTASIHTG